MALFSMLVKIYFISYLVKQSKTFFIMSNLDRITIMVMIIFPEKSLTNPIKSAILTGFFEKFLCNDYFSREKIKNFY